MTMTTACVNVDKALGNMLEGSARESMANKWITLATEQVTMYECAQSLSGMKI